MPDGVDRRSVVVTGMGAVSALGSGVDEIWNAALCGRGGIRAHTLDPGPNGPSPHTVPLALVSADIAGSLAIARGRSVGALDPTALYALHSVNEALEDAKLKGNPALEHRTCVVFGQGNGGTHTLEDAYERFFGRKALRVHPLTVPRIMVSAPVSAITMEFGLKGPAFAVSSACASSGHGIAQGAMLIATGLADVAIVGGSEAIATPGSLRAWESLQAISPTSCRPFSAKRDGTVIGEGAAALILESDAHAGARGARVYARIGGIGMSSDAFHWTQPSHEGAVSALCGALENSGLRENDAVLVSAHGTGTTLNDKNEAKAIRSVLRDRRSCPVIATKSAHGHLIGASTALQAVLGLKALHAGLAPPILNFLGPDEDCDLDLVLNEARPFSADHLIVNSFAFGGLNVCLLFSR